jgi:PIN domain
MRTSGVLALPIEHSHALRVSTLAQHHRDPVDRLLVAQSQVEGIPLVTADAIFERYDVDIVVARQRHDFRVPSDPAPWAGLDRIQRTTDSQPPRV